MNLAAQQQALLQALWQPRHAPAAQALAPAIDTTQPLWQRGLQAYRANGLALAERALAGAYPVLAQLLGEENFQPLARAHWQRHPPRYGDIAQWGGALAAHLAQLPELIAQEPYLADVARVEWALHGAGTAADATPEPASLARLVTQEPGALRLRLAPGTTALASDFAVVSVVNAHRTGQPSLQQAGQWLRDGRAEVALVWRQGLRPSLREAAPAEAGFIRAVQQGRPLADALLAAPSFDFQAWLAPAVHSGLLVGVADLAEPTPPGEPHEPH